jgi:hypothetical protein
MSTASPYNPGFGVDPPYLAGRDEALGVMITGLTTGPRSRYFAPQCSVNAVSVRPYS